jgi:protein ImuA
VPSGIAALDAQLPGGGWPCQGLTEILSPQPLRLEWRLTAPALARLLGGVLGGVPGRGGLPALPGGSVVLLGPPQPPHLPGLVQAGLPARQVLWVPARSTAERLWCAEQLLKAQACAALLLWLPQALPAHIRRLQLCAQGSTALVFVFRPLAAQHESSAAPLRLLARTEDEPATLGVHILKRRGPLHEGWLSLPAWPPGLQALAGPRLRRLGVARPTVAPAAAPSTAPTAEASAAPSALPARAEVAAQVPATVPTTRQKPAPTPQPAQAALFPSTLAPTPHALDRLAPAARRAAARA